MTVALIDGVNRRIYLDASTFNTTLSPIDIYRDERALRVSGQGREFPRLTSMSGNVPKGGGKSTERYLSVLEGARIVPYNMTGFLTVTGTVITDDGQEGVACFDRSGLSVGVEIDLNYVPPQVEIITVSGGSAMSAQESAQLKELWQLAGLDLSNSMSVSETLRLAGSISLSITTAPDGTVTVVRT